MKFPGMDVWARDVFGSLAGVIRRFPLVVLGAFIAAACGVLLTHHSVRSGFDLSITAQKILILTVAGTPILFALSMTGERLRGAWRWASIPAVVLIALCWLLLPPSLRDTREAFWFSYFCLLAAIHGLVAVLPYVHGGSVGFWAYNRSLLTRFIEAGIYAAVLCGGLELALVSANKLFALDLKGEYFADLFVFCAAVFHPLFFLAGISRMESYETDVTFPKILKIFTQVVLAPLCAVYATILYAYAAKIIFARQWPDGWVAMPVLAFSVVGILAWLLLSPLRNDERDRWARWFGANFPRILLPLTVLLLLSLRIRIQQYGYTEFRVLGVVAGFWLLAFAALYSLTRTRDLRLVPGSLFIIGVLISLGPLSAPHIAAGSQSVRLDTMWREIQHQTGDGKFATDRKLKEDFTSTLRYTLEWHGRGVLPQSIVQSWRDWRAVQKRFNMLSREEGDTETRIEILKALGITRNDGDSVSSQSARIKSDSSASLAINGAKAVYFSESISYNVFSTSPVGPFIFSVNPLQARTSAGNKPVNIDSVNQLFTSVLNSKNRIIVYDKEGVEIQPTADLRTDFSFEGKTYTFQILQINASSNTDGSDVSIHQISFLLLEK